MGFKVVSLIDLTLVEMNNAVDMFCDLLSSEVYGNQKFNLLFLIVIAQKCQKRTTFDILLLKIY